MTIQTFAVTGLTCQHCVGAVTEELQSVDGVTGVDVALNPEGASTVTVTTSQPLSDARLAAALDEAGEYRLARA